MSLLTDPIKKKQEFFAINGLRFFAAFWVLLFHASLHFGKLPFLRPIQPLLDQGVLAMTLFFMLSGFILSYRYPAFSKAGDVTRYAGARLARLYPVYLFMGITTLWLLRDGAGEFYLAQRFGPLGAYPFSLAAVFLFVFALQAWFPSLFSIWNFGGSWSLSVEAFFYTLFPKLRKLVAGLGIRPLAVLTFALPGVMAMIAAGSLVSYTAKNDTLMIYYVLPIFRLPEFLLGICGYVLFVERGSKRRLLAFAGGIFAVCLVGAAYWRKLPGWIAYGPLAAFPYMAAFVFCLNCEAPAIVKRCVNYMGRISYCVYIAQFTTIPVLKSLKISLSPLQEWGILISSTLALAILSYHFVEVLSYNKTRDISEKLIRRLASFIHGPPEQSGREEIAVVENRGGQAPPVGRESI